jgi:nicotinamide mononucleotide transporter
MNLSKWLIEHLHEMSGVEWAAALTALVCIWLTVKNRIENWPWGIVSVLIYGWVFWQKHLYASAGLNILYFLPCCIYGWWVWAKCGPQHNDDLPVMALSRELQLAWFVVTVLLSLLIGWLMAHYTPDDPLPYADGAVTGMSIVAQWLQAKKLFENWWYWITLDVLSAGYLYPKSGLPVTTALYVVFLFLAIKGLLDWKPLIGKPVLKEPVQEAAGA